jgi:hypothetical protein
MAALRSCNKMSMLPTWRNRHTKETYQLGTIISIVVAGPSTSNNDAIDLTRRQSKRSAAGRLMLRFLASLQRRMIKRSFWKDPLLQRVHQHMVRFMLGVELHYLSSTAALAARAAEDTSHTVLQNALSFQRRRWGAHGHCRPCIRRICERCNSGIMYSTSTIRNRFV